MEMKKCKRCNEELATSCFGIKRDAKDGFQGQCRECRKICSKQYREDNKEHRVELARQYYQSHKILKAEYQRKYREANPSKNAEYSVKYYRDNPKKSKESCKRYYEKNKPRVAERLRQWQLSNPDKVRISNQKRRSMKSDLVATFTIEEWELVREHFGNRCAYCGKKKPLTQDHFYPLSKDGEYAKENIVPACTSCNCSKSNKLFSDWYSTFKYYNVQRERKILSYLRYKQGSQQLILVY